MAAELKVGIGADNSGLKQGLQDAEAQISAFVSKVGNIAAVGEKLQGIGTKLTAGLTLPLVGLGVAAIKSYGDIQALKKGLEAVSDSADAAQSEFNKLKEVAKLPGLGMQEAVKGSINLQAIEMSADASRRVLQQFGNAVATVGKGRAEFESAIYGVQQLANTDFPLGEDLNIIKDALPQVSNLLKEAFGTSRSDELAKMGISSKQVLETITQGLEKLPRVTGGINGAFENMSDSIKTSLGRIGEIIDKNLDISGIVEKISNGLDSLVTWFEELNPTMQSTILTVAGIVAVAGPLLVAVGGLLAMLPTLLSGLGAVSGAFTALTGPIGLVVVGIGAVIAAVVSNWDKIKPYIYNSINWFRELYNESIVVRAGVALIATMFKNTFAVVSNILKTAWEVFKSFAKNTADLFAGIGSVIKGALTGDLNEIKGGLLKMSSAWSNGIKDVNNDLKNGLNGLFTDLKSNLISGYNSVFNNQKLPPVKIVDEKKIADSTEESIVNGVTKGVKKAKDKVKEIKIELPDIEPIQMGKSSGFRNFLGETYNSMLEFENRTREFGAAIGAGFAQIPISLSENAIKMQEAGIAFSESLNSMISEGAIAGITDAFNAMGEAMFNGSNILAAAGGAILGTLGQFMQMLGTEMIKLAVSTIALGTLVEGIKKFIIANPGAAIALAGVAIVAGALLKGFGSKVGGGSGGSSGSTSTATGGGQSSYSSSFSSGGGSGEVNFRISGNDLVAVLSRQQDKNSRLGG